MINENITDKLIADLYYLSQSKLPEEILHLAKRSLLDYIGVTIAGANMLNAKISKLVDSFGKVSGNATLIGQNTKVGIEQASYINGLSSHVAELDDGVNSGIVHPGSPVISALLSIAELKKIPSKDLLIGIIIGYEATIRLANAIQPMHKKRGFHATGTCGTVGASVGIAAMLKYSKAEMKNAFSAAVVSASGLLKVLEDDSQLKPFNVARAANNGLISALMAKAGFNGPDDVLVGKTGFLAAFSDSYNIDKLNLGVLGKLGIETTYIKPYAACRYCHPAIEAAIKIKSKLLMKDFSNIKDIEVRTYELAVNNHDHIRVDNVSSSKMSIPFSVAVALVLGKAGINEFSNESIQNKNIVSLTKNVKVIADEKYTEIFPGKCCAKVIITTNDNKSYTDQVEYPKGEPENPLTDIELEEKFRSLAMYGNKTEKQCDNIINHVWNLSDDLSNLFKSLK
ncbi:MAG: MmgE/PrpD family protein [Bacteroidota bacterium]